MPDRMRMEELLGRVTDDAGLPPHLNGHLIESDDPSCRSHHRVGNSGWGGYCLARNGEWEHESQPSSTTPCFEELLRASKARTDAFIAHPILDFTICPNRGKILV
jgi:hypothetical protein